MKQHLSPGRDTVLFPPHESLPKPAFPRAHGAWSPAFVWSWRAVWLAALVLFTVAMPGVWAGPEIMGWGGSAFGQTTVPTGLHGVVAIASGEYHNLALTTGGDLIGWGAGTGSSDGPGSWPHYGQAHPPGGLADVVAIAAGQYHSLAISTDGRVFGWGRNDHGQATAPNGLTNAVALAAGYLHSLALTAEGGVVGWGDNRHGQVSIPEGLTNVIAIAAGGSHSLALVADGRLEVWGNNAFGQIAFPGVFGQIIAIAAGRDHCLALNRGGRLAAWGRGDAGQTTIPAGLTNALLIASESDHNLALTSDGRIVAWGGNWAGQTNVPPTSAVVALTAGYEHSLVLRGTPEEPDVPRWTGSRNLIGVVTRPFYHRIMMMNGAHAIGATGLPSGMMLDRQTGVITGQPETAGRHTVSISATNSVGSSDTTVTVFVNLPVPVITTRGVKQIGLGNHCNLQLMTYNEPSGFDATGLPAGIEIDRHTGLISGIALESGVFPVQLIATNSFGTGNGAITLEISPAVAWGDNTCGQSTIPRGLTGVVELAAGTHHTLALLENGQVTAWGAGGPDTDGGDPDFGQSSVPEGLNNAVAVAAGSLHSLALTADGQVVAWGANDRGQATVPNGLTNVVKIAAGAGHNLALTAEGQLHAWGDNTDGQTNVPTGLGNVVGIAAGKHHSVVLTAENRVVAWGSGAYGQCSVRDWELDDVVAVAAGGYHTLALRADGRVVAWGAGSYPGAWPNVGQSTVPADATNVIAIAAGATHSLALSGDGGVIGWGSDSRGQAMTPEGLRGAAAIAAGGDHSVALTGLPPHMIAPQWIGQQRLLGTVDLAFYDRLLALNGAGAYSAIGLPPGLTLDVRTGVISGQASQTGTYELTIQAGNRAGTTTRVITLVLNAPVPAIATVGLRHAGLGNAFSQQVVARNIPDWIGAVGLPPGLAIDPQTGLIHGTATELGEFAVTLRAGNRHGTGTSPMAIRVSPVISFRPGTYDPPPGLRGIVGIAAGDRHSLALTADGQVRAWGLYPDEQEKVPVSLSNVIAVAAGSFRSLALTADGKVTDWPSTGGVMAVPPDLDEVAAIAAGANHHLALRNDGQVIAWGYNSYGQTNVPSGLSNVVAVAAGDDHNLALTADGRVTAWGRNHEGQIEVPWWARDIVAIAASQSYSLALTSEGWVAAWGRSAAPVPSSVSNVVAVAGAQEFAMALTRSGEVLEWRSGQLSSRRWSNAVAIAGGANPRLALLPSPGLIFHSQPVEPGADVTLVVPAAEGQPAWLHWYHDGVLVHSGNTLSLPDVQVSDLGAYVATARFTFGEVTRAVIELSFDPTLRFLPGSIRIVEPGRFQVNLSGPIGQVFEVLSSYDLRAWTYVGSVTNATGAAEFLDVFTNDDRRFYRARTVP